MKAVKTVGKSLLITAVIALLTVPAMAGNGHGPGNGRGNGGNGPKDGTGNGIWFYEIANSSITNCIVQSNEYDGIYLDTCVNITVRSCETSNNWYEGIDLWPAVDCKIIDCYSHNDGDGLCMYADYGISPANNVVEDCDFVGSWVEGFWISRAVNNTFLNISCKNNDYEGIWVQTGSNNNHFINCDVDGNKEHGIYIGWQSNNNTFENCIVSDTNQEPEKGFGILLNSQSNLSHFPLTVNLNFRLPLLSRAQMVD